MCWTIRGHMSGARTRARCSSLRPQKYDVIITEPSNPWTVGIGSVFSREFYELAASRLKPGGIVAQWFHVYEMHDDIVELVLRTFHSVFPYMEIWDAGAGDIVMLGSKQPWATGPDVFQQGFAIDRVRTDMWMIDIQSPEALLARQLASQQTGFAIAGPGPLQSDLFPILEYAAPRAFFHGQPARECWIVSTNARGSSFWLRPEKAATLASLATGQRRAIHLQRLFHHQRRTVSVASLARCQRRRAVRVSDAAANPATGL